MESGCIDPRRQSGHHHEAVHGGAILKRSGDRVPTKKMVNPRGIVVKGKLAKLGEMTGIS